MLINPAIDDVDGKELAVVGMAGELEVDARSFRLLQGDGLMIEQDDGMGLVQIGKDFESGIRRFPTSPACGSFRPAT